MKRRIHAFLSFFRIVNLPTVPGDVLVGVASAIFFSPGALVEIKLSTLCAAMSASCCIYLFGLADNDIVGAESDVKRPIPDGLLTMREAKIAAVLMCLSAIVIGVFSDLSALWLASSGFLILICIFYNRTKYCLLMGLSRGCNVCLGIIAVKNVGFTPLLLIAPLAWITYITFVTKLAQREDEDPSRKLLVCNLIGAHIYLQLIALIVFYVFLPTNVTRTCLLIGAVMLLLLRLLKRTFPKVSAS